MSSLAFLLASVLAQASPLSRDSATICVADARTLAPLVGAEITALPVRSPSRRLTGACTHLSVARAETTTDSMLVVRIGYLPRRVALPPSPWPSGDTLWVSLLAVDATRAEQLAVVQVTAARSATNAGDVRTAGRTTATMNTTDARTAGASTVNAVLALMPFTNVRSARGETGLSLRGARREQVAITLDGMPLNDPATGIADVSDIPLAGLQSATVALGADPVGTGAGATGGVLALTSSAQRVASIRVGAFGQQTVEGAWHASSAGALWQASAAWRTAANDFAFVNDAGVMPQRETRVNNDERRATLSLGVIGRRAQLSVLGSTSERGMVGPANVRTYDADRSRTDRLLARAQTSVHGTTLSSGVRRMQLRYVDPTRPALDSRAVAWAGDAEWRGAMHNVAWRMGGGVDHLAATGDIAQRRSRGFVGVQRAWSATRSSAPRDARWSVDIGARADLIVGNGFLPTASIGAERRIARMGQQAQLVAFGRAAQAVRVPTLYDLYFSSPQRLFVRALSPERVDLDVSSGVRVLAGTSRRHASIEGSLVARNTRDAIVWFPGNFGWSPANVGVERLRGVESRAEVASGIASLSGWITAYDAILSTGGLRIPTPYVPRLAGGAQLQVHTSAHHATIVWRGTGARPYTAGPRTPDFELAAVSLVDITVAQQVRALPHWPWPRYDALVAFSLENVADVSWQSVRGFPSAGRSWSMSFTLQHSPR